MLNIKMTVPDLWHINTIYVFIYDYITVNYDEYIYVIRSHCMELELVL